jgi:citrate lyase beta subunit
MLETPTAIANADEIAAVPGVDVLLIGTNDLCAEMGIHGDFGNEKVAEAYQAMIAACKRTASFPAWRASTTRHHAALHRARRALHPRRPGRPVPQRRRRAAHRTNCTTERLLHLRNNRCRRAC